MRESTDVCRTTARGEQRDPLISWRCEPAFFAYFFRGGWAAGMAANLHSRLASRVLLKIAHRPYRSEQDIYALAVEQRWEQWFSANETLRVDVTAIKSPLRSLEFTTLRVKDAICDR